MINKQKRKKVYNQYRAYMRLKTEVNNLTKNELNNLTKIKPGGSPNGVWGEAPADK